MYLQGLDKRQGSACFSCDWHSQVLLRMKVSLGFGDVKCMQVFNVYFSDSFFVLWRSMIYYVRTYTDIITILSYSTIKLELFLVLFLDL